MDIEFFKQGGLHGVWNASWSNAYEYTTVAHESAIELMLKDRGFLFEANKPHDAALALWRAAQAKMPPNYSDRLRTGPITTAVPAGTKLWLTLPKLPAGYAWGKATLTGQTAKAAWDQIGKYLRAGASQIAHANPAAMVDHVINTPLRQAAGIAHASTDGAGKSLSGDLYFRVQFMSMSAVLPVAPDGKGQSTFESWVLAYNANSLQLSLALQRYKHDIHAMGDDLQKLAQIDRVLEALYNMGNLALIREKPAQYFGNYHPLVHDAAYCHRQVIRGSLPGGRFGFPWSLDGAPSVKAILDQRAASVPIYKELRDAYRKAPATQLAVVNDVCELEAQIVTALLAQGDVPPALYEEIWKANDWLGTASGGDPPDDTKGLGVLLGMILEPLPPELDPPTKLIELAATLLFADGLLSNHDSSNRAALEARIKGGLSAALALPKDLRTRLKEPSGWKTLEEEYKSALTVAKMTNNVSKTAVRVTDLPGSLTSKDVAIGKAARAWVARTSKFNMDALKLKTPLACLRAIGFVTTGIGLVDDAIKLGTNLFDGQDTGDAALKTTKDTISAFGSFARDYYGTKSQLAQFLRKQGMSSEEVASMKALEDYYKPTGEALGVVSGIWTTASGIQGRNTDLTVAGVANMIGYGIRAIGMREAIAGVAGFEVTLPLLLIGAAVELLNALGPAKGDVLMRKQATTMMKGVSDTLHNWYSRYPPWRSAPNSDFEEMLKNVDGQVGDVDNEDAWDSMKGYSEDDVATIRARLKEIGFSESEANTLAPIEHSWDYLMRGTPPPALDPKVWPPNWPELGSE